MAKCKPGKINGNFEFPWPRFQFYFRLKWFRSLCTLQFGNNSCLVDSVCSAFVKLKNHAIGNFLRLLCFLSVNQLQYQGYLCLKIWVVGEICGCSRGSFVVKNCLSSAPSRAASELKIKNSKLKTALSVPHECGFSRLLLCDLLATIGWNSNSGRHYWP